jgi:peptidoglycan/xylan/chitin deacetylase (PgdA/CDA1 family)
MRAILTYHSIDSSGSPISVAEETFRDHLGFFGSGRVAVVPLADLASMPDDRDAVALTFDDGFLNFSSAVQPRLSHLGFAATVFVVSDCVGRSNAWQGSYEKGIPTLPLMGWPDVRRVHDAGIEIGAHTRRHRRLTTLSPAQLEDETAGCVERIFTEVGVRPQRFAYPYGDVNDAVARVARDVFAHSVTTELRALSAREDRALLPRLDAWYFRKPGALEDWGSVAFRRRVWIRAQGRRVKAMMAPSAGGRAQ